MNTEGASTGYPLIFISFYLQTVGVNKLLTRPLKPEIDYDNCNTSIAFFCVVLPLE